MMKLLTRPTSDPLMTVRQIVKRFLVIADLHCGHMVGLTPPSWNVDLAGTRDHGSFAQREYIWGWLAREVEALRPIDILLVNGDAVDGDGGKTGGTEQIYVDRTDQVNMAVDVIKFIDARDVVMSYGTGYHTGAVEDWEDLIAQLVNAEKIGSDDNIEIFGQIFNYRHHLGRSTIPHGRYTPLARAKLWNGLWADRGEYPRANFIIRSHVHYHILCGDLTFTAMTTPALTGYGGKFGPRRMDGTVDIGFVYFDVYEGGEVTWKVKGLKLPMQAPISL